MDTLLIRCIIGLELCKFCVFNNDGFEFKYESECGYYCVTFLSVAIAATVTITAIVIFDPIGTGTCQISRIGYSLIGVLSPTTIESTIPIKYEMGMKYESGLWVLQSPTQTQRAPDRPLNLTHADCDTNNVLKYWCIQTLNGNYDLYVSF